jgi:hypothetical protein
MAAESRIVHDRIDRPHQFVDKVGVGDITVDELHSPLGQVGQRCTVAGVSEFVEHCDVMVGVVHQVMHEIGSDEAGTSGDENPSH